LAKFRLAKISTYTKLVVRCITNPGIALHGRPTILYTVLHRVDSTLSIKVGDFGLARDVYSSDYYRANKSTKLPVKWMPPETLHDGISNEKIDVVRHAVKQDTLARGV
jgi:hypothetical protein